MTVNQLGLTEPKDVVSKEPQPINGDALSSFKLSN